MDVGTARGDTASMRSFARTVVLLSFATFAFTCGGDDGNSGDNPSGVGNRCDDNEDCSTKNCYLGPGGGYCTTPCMTEGATNECPKDTICKPIQGGARRCLLVCGSDSTCGKDECAENFCPRGSACVSVSNASLRACEPQPE